MFGLSSNRHGLSCFPRFVVMFRLLENAIDARMRIKAIVYEDVLQEPYRFRWYGLFAHDDLGQRREHRGRV